MLSLVVRIPTVAQSSLHAPNDVTHITVGQSVSLLGGAWKFTIGDSPLDPVTKKPLWANSLFDDSEWETISLTPARPTLDPFFGYPDYVPGWTVNGHPGYSGYAWYRIRVKIDAPTGTRLALTGPDTVDDGFQVFDNGTLIGSFGDFSSSHPTVYSYQPTIFQLPSAAPNGLADGTRTFAFRVWMAPFTPLMVPNAGGFHGPLRLGEADAVAKLHQLHRLNLIRLFAEEPAEALLCFLFVLLAIGFSVFDRSDKVYSWIAVGYLLLGALRVVEIIYSVNQIVGSSTANILMDAVLTPVILGVWVMMWLVWFRLERPVWLPGAIGALTLLFMVGDLIGEELIFGLSSHRVAAAFLLLTVVVRLGFLALLFLVVILGVRKQGREGWIALPAVLLLGLVRFQRELVLLTRFDGWEIFGVGVTPAVVADLLLALALFLLLLRRLFFSLRLQREQARDIQQAAEVQQVILPESRTMYPGLLIETEYRAARLVGGDFFQIIPHASNGSILIVAGDVTGKGLQAGMTVALLVGAIRSTAELNADPLFLLEALNRRLVGRNSSQATCLALSIAADGNVTLANAGHLPPYLNGLSLEMEGALPLGMIEASEFSVTRFHIAPSDRLVIISDGIIEATDKNGQLFGFDRVSQLLRANVAVKVLADAAEHFGQEDDISLVAVTRLA
ncbi:hypothetical protein HDF16_005786 [Granulicella aggregans]|uniref:PPM-type phosphatase domain-containing protein n=1 Tax=Granulicella aggregans TaxID=474949 RepID=A0A7W7ZJF8_9BACT|nr:hypothetical protein [Granulicella aggregans]